ncbi:hypothetical protein SASPL_115452 [Salvia splendens]|uniref:NB-ARC domain-containing protein n=1 Tax=Salvia splendens TaxID=180675 RepID=A0A8X8Y558_SALSN|nr:hypothetical protein SASPL_115452 [Salvia splendens]
MDDPGDELIEVISILREEPSKIRFIALYDKEGLGNTFLARKAYSDPSVVEHFDIRAWATVSGKYHLPKVIRDLLRSMNVESSSNSENELIQTLFGKLKGMRYLIVLDDVKDFNFIDFHKLRYQMFPNENNGNSPLLSFILHGVGVALLRSLRLVIDA